MVELTFQEFCELPMQYTMGLRLEKSARRMFRNNEVGLQKEIVTPYNPITETWGIGRTYYFLDDDKRCFDAVDQVYVAYMEKVCGVKND